MKKPTHGGFRIGSGRSKLGRKTMIITVTPSTEAKIRREAKQFGTIGKAIDERFK